MDRRPSVQTMAVLRALATDAGTWRHGYELGQEVGLQAGSLYPILIRLHDRGLLDSAWERETTLGRPPRHLYRLTDEGIAYVAAHATIGAPEPDRQRATRSQAGTTRAVTPARGRLIPRDAR